jgi:hypothetical protein
MTYIRGTEGELTMDNLMRDEVARLYPGNMSSDFEDNVRRDIIDWILLTPIPLSGMDMKDVIKLFWNERLN